MTASTPRYRSSRASQHQTHHSDAPRHINKNFGINLSLWDWMFGTLYVTTSKPETIRFGTGEQGHDCYLTVYSLIVTPPKDLVKHSAERRASPNTSMTYACSQTHVQ
ncbi:hypothetical protein DJ564_14505 [Pseudomonas sp. 31-12]|nr:hypothetical protein DJ564_14505 [Pseudomonas sp. 31-12]